MEIFKLIENNEKLVIVQNLASTTLDVARHPYINLTMDYFTITKGKDHVFTIIKKDGDSWSFDFGQSSYTMITGNIENLKNAVLNFLETQGICVDVCTTAKPNKATIYYNNYFEAWQANLKFPNCEGEQNYWSKTATNQTETLKEIKKIFNKKFSDLRYAVAQTGIDTWISEA